MSVGTSVPFCACPIFMELAIDFAFVSVLILPCLRIFGNMFKPTIVPMPAGAVLLEMETGQLLFAAFLFLLFLLGTLLPFIAIDFAFGHVDYAFMAHIMAGQ